MLLEFDTTDVLCGRALQYFEGDGVAADLTEALRLFSLAAERGNPHAQLFLGILNEYGKGMAKDFAEAAKWYRMAAEQGYADAQCHLGGMYKNG